MHHVQCFEAVLAHAALITSSSEQLRQDPAAHRIIINHQDFCMGVIGHLFFDSD